MASKIEIKTPPALWEENWKKEINIGKGSLLQLTINKLL